MRHLLPLLAAALVACTSPTSPGDGSPPPDEEPPVAPPPGLPEPAPADPIHEPAPVGDGTLACPTVDAPPYEGSRGDPAGWDEATRAEVWAAGLEAWRRPDERGASCADCHGVDGLDLAVLAFPDADLMRRGTPHVPVEDAGAIRDLVHLHRVDFAIERPCELEWGVFQPGGAPLEAPTTVEREVLFAEQLEAMGVLLLTEEAIEDADEAARVYRQLVSVDVRRVPIPMPLPRWSDDPMRGPAYRNINDWITDEGVIPLPEAREDWYALHDAYIADPSEENLFAIVEALETMQTPLPLREHPTVTRFLNRLNDGRYLTALLAQHFMRNELTGQPGWLEYGPVAFDLRYTHRHKSPGEHSQLGSLNPFQALQGVSHLAGTACDRRNYDDGNVPADCLGPLPEGMLEELVDSESIWDDDAFGSYSPTWGVLGWLFDVSMMETARISNNMKYWRGELRRRDYDLLLTWMRATSFATKMNLYEHPRGPVRPVPEGLEPTARVLDGRWWRHNLVPDANRLTRGDDHPLRPQRDAAVLRMARNFHVATLHLMDALLAGGAAINDRTTLEAEMHDATELVLEYPMDDAERARIEALQARIDAAIADAPATDLVTVY